MFEEMIVENLVQNIVQEDERNHQKLKNQKRFIFKGYREKTLLVLEKNKLKVQIRYYFDTLTKQYFYPIYEKYGIEKRFRIPYQTRLNIAQKVIIDKQTYQSAGKISNDIFVSKTSVLNYVKEFAKQFKYEVKLDQNPDDFDRVFVCVDDTFRCLKTEKGKVKYRFRVINIYQLNQQNQTKNQVKICCLYETKKQDFDQSHHSVQVILKALKDYYHHDKNPKEIVVCGDGARYIEAIARGLKGAVILDKFHCLNNVFKVFNFRSLDRSLTKKQALVINMIKRKNYHLIKTLLEQKRFKEVVQVLNSSEVLFDKKEKLKELKRLKKYLLHNQQAISKWEDFEVNVVRTETYVQQLVKGYFGSWGKIYCVETFKVLVGLRCLLIDPNNPENETKTKSKTV